MTKNVDLRAGAGLKMDLFGECYPHFLGRSFGMFDAFRIFKFQKGGDKEKRRIS